MPYEISSDCKGCGACAKKCPENAIEGELRVRFSIDPSSCLECGTCFKTCKNGAVIDPQGNRSPQKRKKQKDPRAAIDIEICAGCKTCYLNCPQDAISIIRKGFFMGTHCRVNPDLCMGCGTCTEYCITGAVALGQTKILT